MEIFSNLYNEALFRPLFNGLVWLYVTLPWQDLGLAIIILTALIRLVLTPLLWKGQSAQKKLALLQPEIKKLQEQHKNDKEAQGKALMGLYQTHKINPFSGCVVLLLQLPILIALFHVFQGGFDPEQLKHLYSFVAHPGSLNPISFGLVDLSRGNLLLGAVAAVTQFFQIKMSMPPQEKTTGKKDFAAILQWQSLYIFPALILVWSYTLPSALTLYWTVLNVFGILQELIVKKITSSAKV